MSTAQYSFNSKKREIDQRERQSLGLQNKLKGNGPNPYPVPETDFQTYIVWQTGEQDMIEDAYETVKNNNRYLNLNQQMWEENFYYRERIVSG